MRTTDEFIAEAQRRAIIILERRRRRMVKLQIAVTIVIFCAAVVGTSVFFAWASARVPGGLKAGTCILTGILAMMSGAALTLICNWYKQKSEREPRNAEPNKEDFGI